MNIRLKVRNILLVLVGVCGLLSKTWFRTSIGDLGHAYLGNLSASFAVYFLFATAAPARLGRVWTAAAALALAELFELTDGFGIMTNVYDPFDYLANALGVALAVCVDLVSARILQAVPRRG